LHIFYISKLYFVCDFLRLGERERERERKREKEKEKEEEKKQWQYPGTHCMLIA